MKPLLLAVLCLVISAAALPTPDLTIEKEVEDAIGAEDSDTDSESDPNIQKGEIYQEIGRQLRDEANAPDASGKKLSAFKRFWRAVKRAFKEACKAFVKTGKEAFIREIQVEFEEEIGKVKKAFEMYSLDEETTYQQLMLEFADTMELIGAKYIAKGRKQMA
uniref:Putative secreted protein n=1 Tax=Ixodes ricinus TaxID=34613 RepID=V5I4U0_IXORI